MFEIYPLISEEFHFLKKWCSGINILKQNLIPGMIYSLNTPELRFYINIFVTWIRCKAVVFKDSKTLFRCGEVYKFLCLFRVL